ncbi:hypothetical protein IQ02_01610 [Flavobacterium glaciei]|uniref:Uncharacterized protein n=1 Tax=Flavobacterium glaciei TaxID=386300 RepID=A0A562PSM7_9FLAO|nr:hypothetical protein DFR66_107100 [Flavobacterium glaciei]TWI47160.1 hypothetical protein IQ02_01610 [Flavobacterium glaciei]
MTIEFLLWYLIPLAISLFILIKSILNSCTHQYYLNYFTTLILILLISFSQKVQFEIFFRNSYPTYLPYIIIILSLIIVFAQNILIARKNK